jgi:hypothetical protein
MDYDNDFETTPQQNRFGKPTSSNSLKPILIGVVSALSVFVLVGGGVWLYNKGKSSAAVSSSSTSTLSSSSATSVSQNSTSSTVNSSSSSSSVSSKAVLNKTYTDSIFTNFTFKYDDSWNVTASPADAPVAGGKESRIVLTHKNGSKVTATLHNAGHGIRAYCLTADTQVDINNGWSRVRLDNGDRYFVKTSLISSATPFFSDPGTPCPAGTSNTVSTIFSINGTIESAHTDGIKLELVGEDRAIADDIIRTLTY